MPIDLRSHHFEGSVLMRNILKMTAQERRHQKIQLWNQFVDSGLLGITQEDCGILPRVLPLSYYPEIYRSAQQITLFCLRLLSLPPQEIKAILPRGPIRDFLIQELGVLKHRPHRLVGSFRFDMAIVGDTIKGNPPKLLEVNEIGFGGLSRTTFIQNTMLNLMPELAKKNLFLDPAAAEIRNFQRLGTEIARFQYDAYDWEEEVLKREAARQGVKIALVSPAPLGFQYDVTDYPLLHTMPVRFSKGRVCLGKDWFPEAVQMGYSFELQDYLRAPEMYRSLVRNATPQYCPFITGLVASKAILVVLSDRSLRKKLLGSGRSLESSILHADLLGDRKEEVLMKPDQFVLKHVDGLGGEKVFFDKELERKVKQVSHHQEKEWVAQERVKLNTIETEGTLSRRRRVIGDLGVFVQYDWSRNGFRHFEVGGFLTRATNKTYKVNVSTGGMQMPVIFDKTA